MSSGPVTPYVDFGGNANDTNENNATSIQPIADGEAVNQTVVRRPTENMRLRSEALRSRATDSLFLENADRVLVISGPGKVTWPGSTTAGQNGIPVLSSTLWILPMLTPGFAQAAPVPPVASAFGVLHLKRADSVNAIAVTSQRRSYAAGDQINIQVSPGGVFSCVLDAEDTGALRRTIKIVATGATTLGAVISALNALTPPAPDNTALVVAALEGGALVGDLILTTQARQFVVGNYDGEGHAITPANLASFFSGNPGQVLAEGDTLCVSYAMLFDTASNGGRRQSVPENTNTAIPAGSFFNSRVHPENLYGALPICKVINGSLVFGTGIEIPQGAVTAPLSGSVAANIAYAGGGAWADGTTNPATTVEGQLDKVITDLGGAGGASKIKYDGGGTWADGTTNPATTVEAQLDKIIADLAGAAGSAKIQGVVAGTDLSVGTVQAQLADLAVNWLKMGRANTIAGSQTFSAVINAVLGVLVSANQHVIISGTGKYKRGSLIKELPISEGQVTAGTAIFGSSSVDAVSSATIFTMPIVLHQGERLQRVTARVQANAGDTVTLKVWKQDANGLSTSATQLGVTANNAAHLFQIETIDSGAFTDTYDGTFYSYYAEFTFVYGGGASPRVDGVWTTTDVP